MSTFTSETDLLEALSAHDDLVRRCARGDINFGEFVRLYDEFWWRYALDGHESDRAEQILLEHHANRILVHQKVAEVLSALAPEGHATEQVYERAGRITPEDALLQLRRIASDFFGQ
jgi:hypothetical protein